MNLKGVIMAAGYGSRFLPITKTIPKEMLPLINRPAIDYIIEEFIQAGITDILIITHRKKKALEDYFDIDIELKTFFTKQNKPDFLKSIEPPAVNIQFIRQQNMGGTGDALLLAKNFVNNSPFILAFPDDIVLNDTSLSLQMKKLYEKYQTPLIATEKKEGDVSRFGVVSPDLKILENLYHINNIIEKPSPENAPSNIISIGRYLLNSDIFPILETLYKDHTSGEFYLTLALQKLASQKQLLSFTYQGIRLDVGEPESYIKSLLYIIQNHPQYKHLLENISSN